MKTCSIALVAFGIFLVLLPSCKKECGGDSLSIDTLEPPSNPPGYEIRLKGSGFSDGSVVRFDNSESSATRFLDASTLIATVPAGVLGSVEISVADGDCIARNDRFEVFADFPNTIPFSPATIIIPQAATVYPTNSFQNAWTNKNDAVHSIFLEDPNDPNGVLGVASTEYNSSNSFFNNNPITGYLRFNTATKTSDIQIIIDRHLQPGGDIEIYTGDLITPASVGSIAEYVLLLTSQKDGRQLVFEYL